MDDMLIEVTTGVINHQLEAVSKRLTGEIKSLWQKHISSFKKYVINANKRYEATKTLLYKDRAVLIREMYVGTNIKRVNESISEVKFVRELLEGNRCVVTAPAGAGKSFFAKSVFLRILSGKESIPLLIELRNLNGTDFGFLEYLQHDLKSNYKIDIPTSNLIELIESGRFTLILDGYDELTSEKTKAVNAELLSLEVPFTEASILITTRPGGEDLGYLSGFITFQIKPLTQEQAISLVKKLRYDETVKQSFLKGLEADLFDAHDDFLSNPLLLTIMLMTYSDLAEIPSKMHIFYEQAFDTLFYRHDSSKGMYRRELKSQLAIDDFKDVLSCISASSYIRGQVTLTNTDLLSFIRKAKQTANIPKLTPKNYIDDLVQSVCLLLEDGTRYTYNHRSFQEYFAALFLIQIPTENKIDVYKRYLSRELTDNSLTLAFEINQSVVEKEFIKPMLISVLKVAKSPHELVESWMTGIELERTKRRTRGRSGKIVQRLGKPRYHIINASEFWEFQNYIERMYSKAAKKHIKFGKMTQKAFVEEFGNCEYYEKIKLRGMNAESQEKLDRLGIYEIAKMRLEFLRWLMNDISSRDDRTGESNIESWL